MIYEFRVYRVVQGRMAALLTRFEHQTLCAADNRSAQNGRKPKTFA
jgi:hypothetical protein